MKTKIGQKAIASVMSIALVAGLCPGLAFATPNSKEERGGAFSAPVSLTTHADGLTAQEADVELATSNEEKMFPIVKTVLSVEETQSYVTVYTKGTGYDWMFSGTTSEAKAATDKTTDSRWVKFTKESISFEFTDYEGKKQTGTEEKYGFKLPITKPADKTKFTIPLVAVANSSGAYTQRRIDIDLDAKTALVGNWEETLDVTVSSSVEDVAVNTAGTYYYKGYLTETGTSNEWTSKLTMKLTDKTYDKAYISSEVAKDTDKDATVNVADDGTLELTFTNGLGASTHIRNGKDAKVMMHVASSAPYAEANTWVERSFACDTATRTVAISGDALTPSAATLEARVSSSIETMHVETGGLLRVAGKPNEDGYAITAHWKMRYLDYDQIYIGSAEDAAKASKDELIDVQETLRYDVTFANPDAKNPTFDFSKPIPVAFHVVKTTVNEERWLDRTITIDVENKTIAFAGEENQGDVTLLDYSKVYIGPSNFSYYQDYSDAFAYKKPWDDTTRSCTVIVPDNTGSNFRIYLPPIDAVSGATVTRFQYMANGRNQKEKELPRPSNSKAYYEDMISPAPPNYYSPNNFQFMVVYESVRQEPYTVNIVREATVNKLSATTADNTALHLEPDFSRDVTDYQIVVPEDTTSIKLSDFAGINLSNVDKAAGLSQRFLVNGEVVEDGSYTVPLTGTKTIATVTAQGLDKDGEIVTVPREYKITVVRKAAVTATFKTTPENAMVAVYDKYGARVYAPNNVLAAIPDTYTYTVTCPGYTAESGTINLRKDTEIPITLKAVKEKEATPLADVWTQTINTATNNAITEANTPTQANTGIAKWSVYNARYSIIAGNYVYALTQIPDGLVKLDKKTGEVLKSITFDQTGSVAGGATTAPLLYADGKIFVAQDKTNILRAFDADTLDQLWIYKAGSGATGATSISYDNGFIYAGFNGTNGGLICLTTTDENPTSPSEEKATSWRFKPAGNFYSTGWLIKENYLVCGTLAIGNNTTGESAIFVLDKKTGKLVSSKTGYTGSISSAPVYDEATDRIYFTSYGGHFYSEHINWSTGTLDTTLSKDIDMETGESYCTPLIYGSRAYVGAGNTSAESDKAFVAVIDLEKFQIAYKVATRAGIPTNGVLSTAQVAKDGNVYVYFADKKGNIICLEDKYGNTAPSNGIIDGEKTYLPVIYVDGTSITSPLIADTDGTLLFTATRNSSCELLAVKGASAQLENITFEGGKCAYEGINTSFNPKLATYKLVVDSTTTTVKVTPQIKGSGTIKINGTTVTDSLDVAVNNGDTITVEAIDENEQATAYTFDVRFRGTSADLADIHIAPNVDSPKERYIKLDESEGVYEGVTSQNWCYLFLTTDDPHANVKVTAVSGDSDTGKAKQLQTSTSNPLPYYQLKINYGANNKAEYSITITSEDGTTTKALTLKLSNDDGKNYNLSGYKVVERKADEAVIEFTSNAALPGYYLVDDSRSSNDAVIFGSSDTKEFNIVEGSNKLTVRVPTANKYVHIVGLNSETGRTAGPINVAIPVYNKDCSDTFDYATPATIDDTTTLPDGTYVPTNGVDGVIGQYNYGMRTCMVKKFVVAEGHVKADLGFGAGNGPASFLQMAYKKAGAEEVTFVLPDRVEDGLLIFKDVPLDINGKTYLYMNSSAMNKGGQWYGYPDNDYYLSVEFKAEKADLESLLATAKDAAANVKVSTDGNDVGPEDLWVTEDVKGAFDTALASAEALIAVEDATQKNIDDADFDLADALKTMQTSQKNGTVPQKSDAQTALDAAKAAIAQVKASADGSDVATTDQWVPEDIKKAFDDAVANAEAILKDTNASQAQVDAAKEALDQALKDFNDAKKQGLKKAEESTAQSDKAAADAASTAISKLPDVANITDEDAASVANARKAYNALPDTAKKLVPAAILKKLTDAETAVKTTITLKSKKLTKKVVQSTLKKQGKKANQIKKVVLSKQVKSIKKGTLKQFTKANMLVVKSKKLTKKSVKGALKGSKFKTAQVNVGKASLNKKFAKKYRKLFTKKVAGKKVKVVASK